MSTCNKIAVQPYNITPALILIIIFSWARLSSAMLNESNSAKPSLSELAINVGTIFKQDPDLLNFYFSHRAVGLLHPVLFANFACYASPHDFLPENHHIVFAAFSQKAGGLNKTRWKFSELSELAFAGEKDPTIRLGLMAVIMSVYLDLNNLNQKITDTTLLMRPAERSCAVEIDNLLSLLKKGHQEQLEQLKKAICPPDGFIHCDNLHNKTIQSCILPNNTCHPAIQTAYPFSIIVDIPPYYQGDLISQLQAGMSVFSSTLINSVNIKHFENVMNELLWHHSVDSDAIDTICDSAFQLSTLPEDNLMALFLAFKDAMTAHYIMDTYEILPYESVTLLYLQALQDLSLEIESKSALWARDILKNFFNAASIPTERYHLIYCTVGLDLHDTEYLTPQTPQP